MEKLKKLLNFLSPLPAWLRVVVAALVIAIVSICVLMTACTMASSCGITQSVVNNIASDGNTIELGVTPSTTTSTTVSPEIPINTPLQNSMFAVFLLLTTSSSCGKRLDMRRMCVDADNEDDARSKVSLFFDAFKYASDDCLVSYEIQSIVSLPPLFFWD